MSNKNRSNNSITDENGLNERQRKALPYFIASMSIAESCEKSGVSKQAFYDWMLIPAFKKELTRLRSLAVDEAIESLKGAATKAVNVLIALLDDNSPMVRKGVANDILDKVVRFMEIKELGSRIDVLEEKNAI